MAAVAFPHAHPRRPDGRPDLRLVPPRPRRRLGPAVYARRRLLVLVVVVLVLLALRGLAATVVELRPSSVRAPVAQAPAPLPVATGTTHVVQPGDTLWSIARALQPSGDVRPLVDRLAARNGGSVVRVGETISLA